MIGIIYKYTSPSGKHYIGQTIDEKRRKQEFLNINNKYGGYKIHNARTKYGPENFEYEVLYTIINEDYDELIQLLNLKEQEYIKLYDSIENGYNNTFYGDVTTGLMNDSKQRMIKNLKKHYKIHAGTFKNQKHTESAKKKMSDSKKEYYKTHNSVFKGKNHSIESKRKISESKINYHKTHKGTFTGKQHTEETKQKISKNNSKPILQIDPITLDIIKEWSSSIEACRSFGVKYNDVIHVLKGKRKTWHGYFWKYKE